MNTVLNISLARLWAHEIKHSSYNAFIRPRMICNEDVGEISQIKSPTVCMSYLHILHTVNSILQTTVNSSTLAHWISFIYVQLAIDHRKVHLWTTVDMNLWGL